MTEQLPLPGYKFSVSSRGSHWERSDDEWVYGITIDHFSFGNIMQANCSGGYLKNKRVESIFSKIEAKYHAALHGVDVTLAGYKHFQLTDTRDRRIETEEDLRKVIPIWAEDIHSKVIPWLENWNDLTKINNEIIRNMPQLTELQRYIPGETVFKKLIIMKLLNDPGLDRFFLERLEPLQNALGGGQEKYRSYFEAFLELKSLLDKE